MILLMKPIIPTCKLLHMLSPSPQYLMITKRPSISTWKMGRRPPQPIEWSAGIVKTTLPYVFVTVQSLSIFLLLIAFLCDDPCVCVYSFNVCVSSLSTVLILYSVNLLWTHKSAVCVRVFSFEHFGFLVLDSLMDTKTCSVCVFSFGGLDFWGREYLTVRKIRPIFLLCVSLFFR